MHVFVEKETWYCIESIKAGAKRDTIVFLVEWWEAILAFSSRWFHCGSKGTSKDDLQESSSDIWAKSDIEVYEKTFNFLQWAKVCKSQILAGWLINQ